MTTAEETVVGYVLDYYKEHGKGPTRKEIAAHLGYSQSRNLPGVRAAINAGLIWYDGTPAGRLEPHDASFQEGGAALVSGPIPEDELKDAIRWLAGRTVAAADQVHAMSDAELAEALLTGKWTTLEVHEAGRRLRRSAQSQERQPE